MGAEQPPPPQVSPDGKFYWDGTRWVPMAAPAALGQQPVPPGYAPVPAKAARGMPCITRTGCIILFVIGLLIIFGAAASYLFGSH